MFPEGTAGVLSDSDLPGRAMALLNAIDIVGTPDDLVTVYRACLRRLGMEPTLAVPLRVNVSDGPKEPISPSTRDWLLEHNAVDTALFERVKARREELTTDVATASSVGDQ